MTTTDDLVGTSKTIVDLRWEADCVAPTNSKILITGDSGVGKEALARYIHQNSLRSAKPIITISCAGVPETLLESQLFGHVPGSLAGAHRDRRGLLEMARGGTVFLDEIGEISMRMQTLLLRFLESGEIRRVGSEQSQRIPDVRLISSTSRNLSDDIRRMTFREDLFYRLNVVHLVVPALRERCEDIKPLLDYFLQVAGESTGCPPCRLLPDTVAHLEAYRWPGNVRELRSVVERLTFQFSERDVAVSDLPRELAPARGSSEATLPAGAGPSIASVYYDRMTQGHEPFWTVVYEPFMLRDITRETVRAIVLRGLEQSRGDYDILTGLFNMPPTDCKRFLGFLNKHDCHNMPSQRYRVAPSADDAREQRAGEGSLPLGRQKVLQLWTSADRLKGSAGQ